jgi:hypothetical protein
MDFDLDSKHFANSRSMNKTTFVNTAMEAYEFPKFIPTTGGKDEWSIGVPAVAVPLGKFAIVGQKKKDGFCSRDLHHLKSSCGSGQILVSYRHYRTIKKSYANFMLHE